MESSRKIGRTLGVAAVVVSAGGCFGGAPQPPVPVSLPDVAVEETRVEVPAVAPRLSRPPGEAVVDELLATPMLRDPSFQAEVEEWVDYWTTDAAPWFPDFLARMGRFGATVDSALADHELPASLRYLPFIESGYSPTARSHASAVGMWQFMAVTARSYGMTVDPLLDERRNPYKSTAAAVDYLAMLHDDLGSWFLALAAYNGGPTRTRRILRQRAPLAEPTDSLFWALREHFPPETRAFVPKLLGAIVVATEAEAYGLDSEPDPRFAFDEVVIPDATTLDVAAEAAATTLSEIERLNPELLRGITPPGIAYPLRVPAGGGPAFEVAYARIPPDERVSFVEHTVVSGETLSHIARRYRVTVGDLRAANPRVEPRLLRIGARLTVPLGPSARRSGLR